MTKYLIIFLIGIILVLLLIVGLFRSFTNQGNTEPSPLPVISQPSATPLASPTNIPQDTGTADQIRIQAQADRNFAEKTKQIDNLYPWLDKLPIQSQEYYAYFDIDEKQFIAKLYPSALSNMPVDQQVESIKNEVEVKLQNLIPDYTKYNIRWDVKAE